MTEVAFYAPMKAPTHPVPSGDRTMGRAVLKALAHGGLRATLVSTLQTRDKAGDAGVQARLFASAEAEASRLIAEGRTAGWRAWITYHSYYKAPDLLGPKVSAALHIPYLQIEGTRARKRLDGPWAAFADAAEQASDAAAAIFHLTARDAEALRAYAPPRQRILHLRPFLDRTELPPLGPRMGPMLSVGMLRYGDKFASYQLIADTLRLLQTPVWQIVIAGDGPALAAVASMMQDFGDRVHLRGSLSAPQMAAAYQDASLLFWPGVNEAFGMSYLEAQAAGLPVVAQDRPGVRDVLAPGTYPAPEDGPTALSTAIDALLAEPTARLAKGEAARAHVAQSHLLPTASASLCGTIAELIA
ncbi:glycosyltransferase family 4 protein [Roseobacter sinensis]|uniref:Glycosyltransferase family 4 protein n=1 Tax=Roseobacter sinensis TaxID=2931391 RepID=A0ABT3BCB3_9RHOB|nr:glycosyltransferase family 4 protein [Roseobacter sp. WL0113]MCV3270809.1 glycosyltransferase family 4 protein [Roseobacter sp. WL0113]